MAFHPSFEQTISPPRFARYQALAKNEDQAWDLYRWNQAIASSILPLACDIEVALRNTIHERLALHFDRDDWWASTKLALDDDTAEMLTTVVQRHQKKISKGTASAGRVVADLSFGTWVNLVSRGGHSHLGRAIDYESALWRPALRLGFSKGTTTSSGRVRRPTRQDVHLRAANLQRFRNRAAHHEPVYDGIKSPGTTSMVSVGDVWAQAVELLGWMNPQLAQLHAAENVVPEVLADRP